MCFPCCAGQNSVTQNESYPIETSVSFSASVCFTMAQISNLHSCLKNVLFISQPHCYFVCNNVATPKNVHYASESLQTMKKPPSTNHLLAK